MEPSNTENQHISELRTTLGKMDAALSSTAEAIVWTNQKGVIEWCNKAFNDLTNTLRVQTLGHSLITLLPLQKHGRDLFEHEHPGRILFETKERLTEQYDLSNKKQKVPLEVSASYVEISEDDKIGVFVIRNITFIRKAEEILQNHRKHLEGEVARKSTENRTLARFPDENPSPSFRVDPAGKILYANKASQPVLNVWKTDVEKPLPEDIRTHAREAFQQKERKVIEVRCQNQFFSFVLAPISEAGYLNIYGFDISDRKRAEHLVKEEREQLAVTLSSIGDGIIAVDKKNDIVIFNRMAEQLTGWKEEDVMGKSIQSIFRIKDEKGHAVKADLAKADSQSVACDLIRKDESTCPIVFSTAFMKDDQDVLKGVVLDFRDVSQEREIERLKADFVSSVSHELRTPLTSIKGYTATILRDPDMPDEIRTEFLGIINEESDRLMFLVEDLLEVSRLDSGVVKIEKEPVDLKPIFEKMATYFKPMLTAKNIQYEPRISDSLPLVPANPGKLQSILTNLIGNAIKFTPEKGRVSVFATEKEGFMEIQVADTGMGIPKKDVDKIFSRFYRVDRPGTHIQGTGLGLSIVHKIVSMHDGKIHVESEVGKGTIFTVLLPLRAEEKKSNSMRKDTFNG